MEGVHDESPVSREDLPLVTPLAVAESIPAPNRLWTDSDWVLIRRGHKSVDMDDKWDGFVEGQRLYLHRSWTGRGVYEAEFGQIAGGWVISSVVVEGDRDSYRRQDDAHETALLEALIDGVLLGIYSGPAHQGLARIRIERGMA